MVSNIGEAIDHKSIVIRDVKGKKFKFRKPFGPLIFIIDTCHNIIKYLLVIKLSERLFILLKKECFKWKEKQQLLQVEVVGLEEK